MEFRTEYFFTLPMGFVDKDGNIHKEGIMRMANVRDIIQPMKDPRVQQNPKYLMVILLSRVIVSLGNLSSVDTKVIEGLYTMDLEYLQDLYHRVNTMERPVYNGTCPHCGEMVEIPVSFMETVD